ASSMRVPAQRFLQLRALGAPAVVLSLAIQGGLMEVGLLFWTQLDKAHLLSRFNWNFSNLGVAYDTVAYQNV
ncbi:hypothetical protein M8C21_024829, partial [Ambrosia artemisiifolia]